MNLSWLLNSTIFLTIHGSQAYGMATETSDVDMKGVCIPPSDVEYNLFNRFDQAENHEQLHIAYSDLINPKNPKLESVVYNLSKFVKLAAAVNPNIIELLFVDPKFVLIKTKWWNILHDNRELFLSTRARHTFTGYANAQLGKINRHRKWLLKEIKQPTRQEFGLDSNEISREYAEAGAYIKRQIEEWNLSSFDLDKDELNRLKENCWDLVANLNQSANISWDNWPESYFKAALVKLQNNIQLPKNILVLIQSEHKYQTALKEYNSYLHWKNERNAHRKELELKCGYDSKSAAHLVRLVRMGFEIISEGNVIVYRPDANELLSIRHGAWSYDKLIDYSLEMQEKIKIAEKQSPLPRTVNYDKINDLYHGIIEEYRS